MLLSYYYSGKAHRILATVNAHGAWASVKTGRKLRKTSNFHFWLLKHIQNTPFNFLKSK